MPGAALRGEGAGVTVVGELGRSAAGYALWCNGIEDFAELRRRHLVPQPPTTATAHGGRGFVGAKR